MTTIQTLKPHVSLNVRNVEESITFYQKMLGIEPCKVRTGYAKFDVQNLSGNVALWGSEVSDERYAVVADKRH